MKSFLNFLKILALVLVTLTATFLVVWPLWKFATSTPSIYTWTVLALLFCSIIFLIIKKIINKHAK